MSPLLSHVVLFSLLALAVGVVLFLLSRSPRSSR